MTNDDIRTRVLDVEGATQAMRSADTYSGWENLRDRLQALTNQACNAIVDQNPGRTPGAGDLYVCDVLLPDNLYGNLIEIEKLSKMEVESVLRAFGFAVDTHCVAVMVHYVSGEVNVELYVAQPTRMPEVGTFLFLQQHDEQPSGFPLNPANGSLELSGSSNASDIGNRRHRYPLRLGPDYPQRSWVRFRNSNGRLQACFLLPDADFWLIINGIDRPVDVTNDWQDLPDKGVIRVSRELNCVDVHFICRRPPQPDVGRMIEFHIGDALYPAYSRVEAGDTEYLKYYDCFNDQAASLVRDLFREQNRLIIDINDRTRASLGIRTLFKPISTAESITINDFLAETAIGTRRGGGAAGTSVTRDDGSLVVSSQVVLTRMRAMQQMRDKPIVRSRGDCESVLRPIAAALDTAHARLCFHGDIKPDNVCWDIKYPKWLTLIDTESFSSFSGTRILPSSGATPRFADPDHMKALNNGSVPTSADLLKSDRRGFVAVVLATWIGRGAANQVFGHRDSFCNAAMEVLTGVSDKQRAVLDVLESFSKRTAEDNPNWCADLLTKVEAAAWNAQSGGGVLTRALGGSHTAADIEAILSVARNAHADSLIDEAREELSRRIGLRIRRITIWRWIVFVVIVVLLLLLFVILGGHGAIE